MYNKLYHKIPTIYKRNEKTHKLIEGEFRDKQVEYLKDNIWEFTQKLNGTNIRVIWDGYSITFGGRTNNTVIQKELLKYLETNFKTKEIEQIFEQNFGEKPVILFGEGVGPKINKGKHYGDTHYLVLFDVMVDGYYLNRNDVEEIAEIFRLETAPVVLNGTIKEAIEFIKCKPYDIYAYAKTGTEIISEGLVGRPKIELYNKQGKRIIVKIKTDDFN